ncbi:Protein DELETION OF SUV3 SUPPRESSOR 1(I) [Orobanche gracilis]
MASEQAKPATDEVKMDLFEDDDEFEEFGIDQDWGDKEGKEGMPKLYTSHFLL